MNMCPVIGPHRFTAVICSGIALVDTLSMVRRTTSDALPAVDPRIPLQLLHIDPETLDLPALPVFESGLPMLLDHTGLRTKSCPVMIDHDHDMLIGEADEFHAEADGTLVAGGWVSGETPHGRRVIQMECRYRWAISTAVRVPGMEIETVAAGSTIHVNGRDHVGPLIVVRVFTLTEFSVTLRPADEGTSFRLLPCTCKGC